MSVISEFLNSYSNPGTIRNYRSGIQKFLSWKYNHPISGVKASPEERAYFEKLSDQYIHTEQNYSQDILAFISDCNIKETPPKSIRNWVGIVKEWLAHYEKPVNVSRIRRKIPKGGSLDESVPDASLIKRIVKDANFKTKLLILFLCSTGLRINEALSVRVQDITEKDNIGIVNLKGKFSKTRNPRMVFLTPEVMELYKIWIKTERNDYLKSSDGRSSRLSKNPRKESVFPFHDSTAEIMLETALKHAGLLDYHEDMTTDGRKRKLIHFHLFRKFFDTTCALNGMPDPIRYSIIGHQRSGMDQIYLKVPLEAKEKAFRDMIPKLTILQDLEQAHELALIKTKYEKTEGDVKLLLDEMKKKDKEIEEIRRELVEWRSSMRRYVYTDEKVEFVE